VPSVKAHGGERARGGGRLLGDSITQEAMRASECFLQEFWGMAPPWSKPTDNASAVAVMMTRGGMEPWCMELIEGTRVCHIRRRARAARPNPDPEPWHLRCAVH